MYNLCLCYQFLDMVNHPKIIITLQNLKCSSLLAVMSCLVSRFFCFFLQHKYDLHAVMVHEGEAISGHYWSYVYNSNAACWLKFNDISVTQSSWQEVVRESEGGSGTASAYCLIYIKSGEEDLHSNSNSSTTAGKVMLLPAFICT